MMKGWCCVQWRNQSPSVFICDFTDSEEVRGMVAGGEALWSAVRRGERWGRWEVWEEADWGGDFGGRWTGVKSRKWRHRRSLWSGGSLRCSGSGRRGRKFRKVYIASHFSDPFDWSGFCWFWYGLVWILGFVVDLFCGLCFLCGDVRVWGLGCGVNVFVIWTCTGLMDCKREFTNWTW